MRRPLGSTLFMVAVVGLSASTQVPKPISAQDSDSSRTRDVPYSGQFLLDIHVPEGLGPFPVVVTLHGASGGKAAMSKLAVVLAEHGHVVFNAEWLAPARPLDAAAAVSSFEAAACALRVARTMAEEFDGDSSSLTVIGLSAGGLAGAVVALGDGEFDGQCIAPEGRSRVSLFVGLEGQYIGATERGGLAAAAREQPELIRRLDPRTYLEEPGDLRVVLFLGDQFAPAVAPAEDFLTALEAAGVPNELRHATGPHRATTFAEGVVELLQELR
jgi:acetyl esterase/lipase